MIATGAYFAFSDGVLPCLIDGQTKEQNHYKDHITELSAQVDRVSARFLHNQQVEQQLAAQLNERVDRIEQLGQNMSALADLLRTDTIKQDRIEPPITLDVAAPSSREVPSKSRELRGGDNEAAQNPSRRSSARFVSTPYRSGGAHLSPSVSRRRNVAAVEPSAKHDN